MSKTNIPVRMVGENGNAFAVLGRCRRAMCDHHRLNLWDEFYKEATSGDYNHLLATVCDFFDVDSEEDEEDDLQRRIDEISED